MTANTGRNRKKVLIVGRMPQAGLDVLKTRDDVDFEILADDSVAITTSTIHRIRWLPAGHGPGEYVLVGSAVIDGRSVVEGAPIAVRIQNR